MDFVARKQELALLDSLYKRSGAQFLVLYGRRRVGKTRLITHWLSRVQGPHLYWMATQTTATNQLRKFSQALFGFLHPGVHLDPTFSYATWEAAFAEVARASQAQRLVLVLDEFTYAIQADPEVPSLTQKAWDHALSTSNLFLVLTGSQAGIIQRAVLDYQSPLYGRATARLKLQPLPFGALSEMLPSFSTEQRVAVYAITGGIPAYASLFDDHLTLLANLQERIVTPANVMLSDAAFLLHEQLDEPRNYMALIEAIASGYHKLSDIALMAGIDRSNVGKYLAVLRELGYVERHVPATVRDPDQSRQGRYVIADSYLRFYYRFLAPNIDAIESGRTRQALSLLHDHLLDFIGTHTWEELCREWVGIKAEMGELAFLPERIGSFWSQTAQVDVVALNWRTHDALLGECKWSPSPVDVDVLKKLVTKMPKVLPAGIDWRNGFAFFTRQQFSPEAERYGGELGAQLVALSQLETDFRRWMNR